MKQNIDRSNAAFKAFCKAIDAFLKICRKAGTPVRKITVTRGRGRYPRVELVHR